MRILALDTALPAVCACVLDSGSPEPLAMESLAMERGHAEALLPLIERVMAKVEGGFASLDRIAVTVGPGSFTGIRVAISAARSFGVALDIPVVGVSTLAAFAAPLVLGPKPVTQKPASPLPAIIVPVIDARHGQVYLQACSQSGAILMAPTVLPLAEAVEKLPSGPLRLTGSAAPLLAIAAWSAHRTAEVEGETVTPIQYVARLGMIADPEAAPPRPLYIKAPDVKPPSPFRFVRA